MIKKYIFSIAFILSINASYAQTIDSPVGYWQTIDDVTSQPKSIVQISETANHMLEGRVVKLYTDAKKVCTACKDARKDQPIVGMVVIQGLHQNKSNNNLWEKGEILDPKNGKIYHCNLQTLDNSTKLRVRGYFGVPLFGRSQTWNRVLATEASTS